ncbi:glycosyltransferase family 2 protein [Mangrovicella endophytica]|uniref:glycosyltransferase family 2 protein n=1 Tax=Mangrovicella endophytica TaxID=2066697 RepID=UPI000C9DB584|nr:glycosyltransferase [Mangrovicella endophytica]
MSRTSDPVTIEVVSPGLDRARIRYAVTLPTFRRPDHLLLTLDSLARQRFADPFAVIVMENDAEGRAGLEAARPLFASGQMTGLVIIAHERGNCSAYNAGWTTALAEFPALEAIAVIDDDELAVPEWLERIVATADRYAAELVGAPQVPIFEGGGRDVYRNHPVFVPHYAETGPVPVLFSSGNVLIRRRVLEVMPRPFLDPGFNFIGGGDSDFYSRCRAAGFRFAWCAEAPVHETTPARRTEFTWLQARGLRNGALSSIIERRRDASPKGRLKTIAKSGALLAASPLRSLALGWRTRSAVIGLYHIHVAVGRFLGEFGLVNEQYRRPEQN